MVGVLCYFATEILTCAYEMVETEGRSLLELEDVRVTVMEDEELKYMQVEECLQEGYGRKIKKKQQQRRQQRRRLQRRKNKKRGRKTSGGGFDPFVEQPLLHPLMQPLMMQPLMMQPLMMQPSLTDLAALGMGASGKEMEEEVVELEVEELAAGLVGCTKGTPINVIFFMADNAFCTFARVAVKR